MPDRAKLTVELLSSAKDVVPFLAIFAALAYSLGWAIRYGTIASFGVGPVGVAHEAAITTTLALITVVTPGFCFAAYVDWAYRNERPKPILAWTGTILIGTSLFLFASFVLVWMPLKLSEVDITLIYAAQGVLLGEWLFTLATLGIMALGNPTRILGFASLIILSALYTRMFCYSLLPKLPEALGGLGQSRVLLHLKDPI